MRPTRKATNTPACAPTDIGQALLQARKLDKANVEAAADQERKARIAARRESGGSRDKALMARRDSGGSRDKAMMARRESGSGNRDSFARPRRVIFDKADMFSMETAANTEKAHGSPENAQVGPEKAQGSPEKAQGNPVKAQGGPGGFALRKSSKVGVDTTPTVMEVAVDIARRSSRSTRNSFSLQAALTLEP